MRLKMIVVVANAPQGGVPVIASWELRGIPQGKVFLSYRHRVVLSDGRMGVYVDVTLPAPPFAPGGTYRFVGAITLQGRLQQKATIFHVVGQILAQHPYRPPLPTLAPALSNLVPCSMWRQGNKLIRRIKKTLRIL